MPDDSQLSPLPENVDVAIIGGGYTGLSAARTLSKLGVHVAVLEANTIGWGASSRNGGMVLTGLKNMGRNLRNCSFNIHWIRSIRLSKSSGRKILTVALRVTVIC
jgi:glycine/D-amino acid oxidase-like deaminating enzyme